MLHSELVALQPYEPFAGLRFCDLFSTSVSGRCTEPQGLLFEACDVATVAARASVYARLRVVRRKRGGGGERGLVLRAVSLG